jgi:hypothetical protein
MVTAAASDDCTASGLALDDDCDGEVDEDCECATGDTQDCYGGADGTQLIAPCMTGTQTCGDDERFGTCTNDRVPAPETCENDGADDDCDEKSDEIPSRGMACSDPEAQGVCRLGAFDCQDEAFGCVTREMSAEQCNALDDDCDGDLDEDFELLGDELNCGQCGKQCSGDLSCCGAQCVDVSADENHCGECGEACAGGSTCCGGACVDTSTSSDHCGACGEACGAGRECCGGACVDTRMNTDHCGACQQDCATDEACCLGQCAAEDAEVCATCSEDCEDIGQQCCSGSCVDQDSDEFNCGTCGNACDQGEVCCAGDCVASDPDHCGQSCTACDAGDLCCGGDCVASDAANCHSCGNVCTAGTTCCGATGCKDLLSDPNNCGTCGDPVDDGDMCASGHSCPMNNAWCAPPGNPDAGACTAIVNNNAHCGACNNACPILNSCVGTQCRLL